MNNTELIESMNPCTVGLKYLKSKKDFKEAWNDCERGDWMLWIAAKLNVDFKLLTKAKALCALTVRHLMKDERSIKGCEVALLFSECKASMEDLKIAASDASSAASDASSAAYVSTYSAADAAYVATDYDASAAYAAYASAYASASSSAAAAADDARISNQINTANICRNILTEEVFKKLNETK